MRKPISMIAACALVLSTLSCQVEGGYSKDKTSELGTFADNFVGDVIIAPVTALMACETEPGGILLPGFEATKDGIYLKLLSAGDSVWSAANEFPTDLLTFSTTIKMLPDKIEGFHRWKVEGQGRYVENETYMATLGTASAGVMDWVEDRTSISYNMVLTLTGSFVAVTELRSTAEVLNHCVVTYEKSKLDTSRREYRTTVTK